MEIRKKIDPLGRIVLLANYRTTLKLHANDYVVVSLEKNIISIKSEKSVCLHCGSVHQVNEEMCICKSCIEKILKGIKNANENSESKNQHHAEQ